MWTFYFDVLSRTPQLFWESLKTLQGVVGLLVFLALCFFGKAAAERLTEWHVSKRKWTAIAVAAYFVWLLLPANYATFEAAQDEHKKAITDLTEQIEDTKAEVRTYRVEMEKLAVQNVDLMRGAPVLTGKAARVAEMRKQLLMFAETAPSESEFTKQKGTDWMHAASTLTSALHLKAEARQKTMVYDGFYEGDYKTFMQVVNSVRAAALNIDENDLAE